MHSDRPWGRRSTRFAAAQSTALCLFLLLSEWGSMCAWAQRRDQVITLAVLDFALNLALANAGEAGQDQLPVTMASASMRAQVAAHASYVLVEALADTGVATALPCTSDACAVQRGQALGVQRVIRGQVTKVSALIWYVSVRMIDVHTATPLQVETVQFRGNISELMPRVMAIVWRRMHETE